MYSLIHYSENSFFFYLHSRTHTFTIFFNKRRAHFFFFYTESCFFLAMVTLPNIHSLFSTLSILPFTGLRPERESNTVYLFHDFIRFFFLLPKRRRKKKNFFIEKIDCSHMNSYFFHIQFSI